MRRRNMAALLGSLTEACWCAMPSPSFQFHALLHSVPTLIRNRLPAPYLTRSELTTLMQWKLTGGKFKPRLLNFAKSLDEELVKSASEKAFLSLPDLSKSIFELVVLKGIGPATASAVIAAYAPYVAPFMSDEAMEAVLGNSKEYTLKQYVAFASKLMTKAKAIIIQAFAKMTVEDSRKILTPEMFRFTLHGKHFELLGFKHDVADNGSANWFLQDLACEQEVDGGMEIARYMGLELRKNKIKRFADSEIYVQLEESVRGCDVYLIQPTSPPANENIMELLIMIDACRRASAKTITAVIPYFGYARADRKTQGRESIGAKLVANQITKAGASRVLACDLHSGQSMGYFDPN